MTTPSEPMRDATADAVDSVKQERPRVDHLALSELMSGSRATTESRYDDTRRYLEGDSLDPRCTGYIDEIGHLAHDGDTCPIHESGDVDPGDEVQSCRDCGDLFPADPERDRCPKCVDRDTGTYTLVLIDRSPEHASDGDFVYVEGVTYADVNGPGRERLTDRLADAIATLDARP